MSFDPGGGNGSDAFEKTTTVAAGVSVHSAVAVRSTTTQETLKLSLLGATIGGMCVVPGGRRVQLRTPHPTPHRATAPNAMTAMRLGVRGAWCEG